MVKNLRFLRTQKHISQQQLAEFIGISQQSVNKYENHSVEPDIEILIKLADFFGTSVDFLVGHTDINRTVENVTRCDLNDDELNLIESYRRLNINEKNSIRLIVDNYLHK